MACTQRGFVFCQTSRSVQFAELRSALAKLPAEQREAVLLIGAAGLSYEEAAKVSGTKIGTIKSRVNRARTRLTTLLDYEDGAELGPDGVTSAALEGRSAASLPVHQADCSVGHTNGSGGRLRRN